MGVAFVFCRFWRGFTPKFPFARFNSLPEDCIEPELRAAVERDGPPDDAMAEWFKDVHDATLRGSPVLPDHKRAEQTVARARSERPGGKLGKWLEQHGQGKSQMPPPLARDVLLVRKMQWMGWLTGPILWSDAFVKRHVLLVAPSEQLAAEVANALAERYKTDRPDTRFGSVAADALPLCQQLLLNQEAERNRTAALNPIDPANSLPLAGIVRCALDLLSRATPRMSETVAPETIAKGEEPAVSASLSKEAKALAALADHPDWTDEQVAQAAGCHRQSLYRMKRYMAAKEMLKDGKSLMPKGSKDRETGDVEAWEGGDDE